MRARRWGSGLSISFVTTVAACGQVRDETITNPPAPPTNVNPPPPVTPDPTPTPTPYDGDPLCKITTSDCDPDADLAHPRGVPCAQTSSDGGGIGCRLGSDAPTCAPTGSGTDAAKCTTGADCAPGFDCVGDASAKACRHYCCHAACDPGMYCDDAELADTRRVAPVCLHVAPCTLLDPGNCPTNETCAVVNDTGDTGCIAIGDANVGDSCDGRHCAEELTCLGQPGNRKCYALCEIGVTPCPSGKVCKTTSAFRDPNFGICMSP